MPLDDDTKQALEEIRAFKKQQEERDALRGKWQLIFSIGAVIMLLVIMWIQWQRLQKAGPRETDAIPPGNSSPQ